MTPENTASSLIVEHTDTQGNPTNITLFATDADFTLLNLICVYQLFHKPVQFLTVFSVYCVFKIIRQYLNFFHGITHQPEKLFISAHQLPVILALNHGAPGRHLLNHPTQPFPAVLQLFRYALFLCYPLIIHTKTPFLRLRLPLPFHNTKSFIFFQ